MSGSIGGKMSKSNISYCWGNDTLLILLGKRIEPRIQFLFWAEFLFTSGMATVFLMNAMPLSKDYIHILSAIGSAGIYILAAYRFISRMFSEERILLDPEDMTIINRTPFSQKTMHYNWDYIGPLHYAGKATKTDHPLKGGCYDYFGFETQEHLIQSLHHDGNMFFHYEGFQVRFAKGVYSWDAEEIVRMMQIYAGNALRLGPEWKKMMQESEWGDA